MPRACGTVKSTKPAQNVQLGSVSGIGHTRPSPQLASRAITGIAGGKGNLRGSVLVTTAPRKAQPPYCCPEKQTSALSEKLPFVSYPSFMRARD